MSRARRLVAHVLAFAQLWARLSPPAVAIFAAGGGLKMGHYLSRCSIVMAARSSPSIGGLGEAAARACAADVGVKPAAGQ